MNPDLNLDFRFSADLFGFGNQQPLAPTTAFPNMLWASNPFLSVF